MNLRLGLGWATALTLAVLMACTEDGTLLPLAPAPNIDATVQSALVATQTAHADIGADNSPDSTPIPSHTEIGSSTTVGVATLVPSFPIATATPQTPLPTSTPTPTPLPTATATPLLTGKDVLERYESARYGFSFDVPKGWILEEVDEEYVYAYSPDTDGYIAVAIDPDISAFPNGDVWQTYWWMAGKTAVEPETYKLIEVQELPFDEPLKIWNYVEEYTYLHYPVPYKGTMQLLYLNGLGIRLYEESPIDVWLAEQGAIDTFYDSFVAPPPPYPGTPEPTTQSCESLETDSEYSGTIMNTTLDQPADISINFIQLNCHVVGRLDLSNTTLVGSGAFYGSINDVNIDFVVPGITNDAGVDLEFDGTMGVDGLVGAFSVADSEETGLWTVTTNERIVAEPTATPTASPTATPIPVPTPTPVVAPTQPPIVFPTTPAIQIVQTCIDGEFEGWEGETVFRLCNGQIWEQVSYAYHYVYAFNPSVTLVSDGDFATMTIDSSGESITVQQVTSFIDTCISSDFNGWDGDTIFELCNGQVWQQSSFDFKFSFKFRPSTLIYESVWGGVKMSVEGISETISVVRLQ